MVADSYRIADVRDHCRRRKIRCVAQEDDPSGACGNCLRLGKDCNFQSSDDAALPNVSAPQNSEQVSTSQYQLSPIAPHAALPSFQNHHGEYAPMRHEALSPISIPITTSPAYGQRLAPVPPASSMSPTYGQHLAPMPHAQGSYNVLNDISPTSQYPTSSWDYAQPNPPAQTSWRNTLNPVGPSIPVNQLHSHHSIPSIPYAPSPVDSVPQPLSQGIQPRHHTQYADQQYHAIQFQGQPQEPHPSRNPLTGPGQLENWESYYADMYESVPRHDSARAVSTQTTHGIMYKEGCYQPLPDGRGQYVGPSKQFSHG